MKITKDHDETLLDTGRFTVHKGEFTRWHTNGETNTVDRVWVSPGNAAAVLPYDAHYFYMAEQPREITGRTTLSLCAGKIEPRERPLDTAKRELSEEMGMQAASWYPLGWFYSSEGFTTEETFIYLAAGAFFDPTATNLYDEEEAVVVRQFTFDQIGKRISECDNAKAMIALQALALHKLRDLSLNIIPAGGVYNVH